MSAASSGDLVRDIAIALGVTAFFVLIYAIAYVVWATFFASCDYYGLPFVPLSACLEG